MNFSNIKKITAINQIEKIFYWDITSFEIGRLLYMSVSIYTKL